MNLWYEGALIRRSNESSDAEKMEEAPEGGSEDSKEKERKRKKKRKKEPERQGTGQNLGMSKFLARCQRAVILL